MRKTKILAVLLLSICISTACTNRANIVSEIKSNNEKTIQQTHTIIDNYGPFLTRVADQVMNERLRYVWLSENGFEFYDYWAGNTKHVKIGNLTVQENNELQSMFHSDTIRNINVNDWKNVYFETSFDWIKIMKAASPVDVLGSQLSSIGIAIEEYKGFVIVYPCNRNICITNN